MAQPGTEPRDDGTSVTLGNADGVTVTVPGGLIPKAAKLTVTPSPAATQLPKPNAAAKIIAAYDISLGTQTTFEREIRIEIPYDPATLDRDCPEGMNLWVSSWDPVKRLWSPHRAEVDTARKRIIVHTDHLSTWAYWTLQGYKYVEGTPLVVPFTPTPRRPTPPPPVSALVVYYHPAHTQPRTDVPPSYTMRDLANTVLSALTTARTRYAGAGFRPLDYQVNAIITDISDRQSEMSNQTGNIALERTKMTNAATLRQDAAHELFHVVQNRYYYVRGMQIRRWWIEATPDYAASVVAFAAAPEPTLDQNFFDESLFSNDGTHANQNCQFIDYLVTSRNASFKAMWDAVYNNSGVGNTGVVPFRNYVSQATGKIFEQVWRDFVDYEIFDPTHRLPEIVHNNLVLRDNTGTIASILNVPSYAAKAVRISFLPAALGRSNITVTAKGLGNGVIVEIWQGRNNERGTCQAKAVLVEDRPSSMFSLDAGTRDDLWAVVMNAGEADRSVT